MKKTVFLAGAMIWAVIALMILVFFVGMLTKAWSPSFFKGGLTMFGENTKLVKEETFPIEGIHELSLGTYAHTINITWVEGNEMTVRQYDINSDVLFAADRQEGQLNINIPQRKVIMTFGVNIDPRLEVSLPRSYADTLALKTSSGTVRIEEGITCSALSIQTSSGSVRLGAVNADSVNISSNSGTQRLDNIRAAGWVSLHSTSGSIHCAEIDASGCNINTNSGTLRVEDIKVRENISLESTSGSIHAENLHGQGVFLKSNSGTISCSALMASGDASVSSSSGSQNIGSVDAVSFHIGSNSGTLRYGNIVGTGSMASSSGSIHCGALDVKGNVSITSSSGTQRITLAADQSLELQVNTSSGSIRADGFGLSYTNDRGNSASATLGNGEGSLRLKSSSGSVHLSY